MSQSTARKPPAPTNDRPEDRPHVLTLPLEEQQADREPHSYERWLIAKLMRMAGSPPLRFQLWNNEFIDPEEGHARFTLKLTDPKALFTLVTNPNLAFGDLYSAGTVSYTHLTLPTKA